MSGRRVEHPPDDATLTTEVVQALSRGESVSGWRVVAESYQHDPEHPTATWARAADLLGRRRSGELSEREFRRAVADDCAQTRTRALLGRARARGRRPRIVLVRYVGRAGGSPRPRARSPRRRATSRGPPGDPDGGDPPDHPGPRRLPRGLSAAQGRP